MRHIVLLTISLFATNSLTPMEKIITKINPFKKTKKTKNISPNKALISFTLINKITTNHSIPNDVSELIQGLYLSFEKNDLTRKHVSNVNFINNLRANNLTISHLLLLNEEQESLFVKYLTLAPNHLESKVEYKLFLTHPIKIRKRLHETQNYVLVKRSSAMATDLTLGITDSNSSDLGLVKYSMFTQSEKKRYAIL